MEKYNRKAVFSELKDYCTFSVINPERGDFMEVTEWYNGEGFDVEINGVDKTSFSMTHGQFTLLKKLIKELDK
jgi:hypothetical protein